MYTQRRAEVHTKIEHTYYHKSVTSPICKLLFATANVSESQLNLLLFVRDVVYKCALVASVQTSTRTHTYGVLEILCLELS